MLKVLRVGEPQRTIRADEPRRALKYWNGVIKRQAWFDPSKEHLVTLILSTKSDIEGYSMVSIGNLNQSIAHPREIFRAAIASGACTIIVMHNHPSGDPTPSRIDRETMARLSECGELLDVRLLDFIIVGQNGAYYSRQEERCTKSRKRRKPPPR